MGKGIRTGRRGFIQTLATGAALGGPSTTPSGAQQPKTPPAAPALPPFEYPRVYTGRQLAMIAFPLGGIGTGSISLGGRGQLRDWEIYNHPDKGRSPEYALPAIRVQASSAKPVTRVLESRLLPPYASASGLGPANAPGLTRIARATFTGEFPVAHIAFQDPRLPVRVTLACAPRTNGANPGNEFTWGRPAVSSRRYIGLSVMPS